MDKTMRPVKRPLVEPTYWYLVMRCCISAEEYSYNFLLLPKMKTATSTEHKTESSWAFLNRPPFRLRKVLEEDVDVSSSTCRREWVQGNGFGDNIHRAIAVIPDGLDLNFSSTHFELQLAGPEESRYGGVRWNGARGRKTRGSGSSNTRWPWTCLAVAGLEVRTQWSRSLGKGEFLRSRSKLGP